MTAGFAYDLERSLPAEGSEEETVRPLPELTPMNEWFWTSGVDATHRSP